MLNKRNIKKLFSLAVFFITAFTLNAQTSKDVFNSTEVVWYGLDFTKARFVGQFDQGFGALPATGTEMKNKWIPQWNALIVKEPQNFKLKEALRKDNVYYELAPLNEINSKIDVDKAMTFNAGKIERSEIDAMVKNYGPGDKKSGVGLTFIIENFDKNMEMATVYVTFFDIATKKILFVEKMSGKAMGAGMRNYWAGSIKAIIKQIDSEYKNWKEKA